jgi:hypothetical protein
MRKVAKKRNAASWISQCRYARYGAGGENAVENKKGRFCKSGLFLTFWLPDLDSNQGPAD